MSKKIQKTTATRRITKICYYAVIISKLKIAIVLTISPTLNHTLKVGLIHFSFI